MASGILQGWRKKTVRNPRGAWTAMDQIKKGLPSRSFVSQNVRFAPGHVYSREGTTNRLAVAGKVTSLYNWITSAANLVLYFESGTTIKSLNVTTGVSVALVPGLSGRGITVAEAGPRAHISTYATTGLGAAQCRVTDGTAAVNDKAFHPPLVPTSWTAVDNGAGLCTKGTHKVAFIFQSRTGFAGKPSPAPLDVFTPATVTLAAGKRTIRANITMNTPAEAGTGSAVLPIMTRADNPNRWFFVPAGMYSPDPCILPPSGVGWSQNIDISISDEDLANRAESADNWFNAVTQVVAGTGPFNPSVVFPYGKRIVYVVDSKAYVSEIDDTQFVTEDFNVVQVAGQRRIIAGFPLRGSMYLLGEKWTYESTDNGDHPATWAQPREVSAIGTSAPRGVEWRTAGDYAWVAAESGLYVFTGSYPEKPISYLQSDVWARINWAAAYSLQVVDDTVNRRVTVAAPLDAATEPSHLLVWDYTNGLTSETADFSLDNYPATVSAVGLVKEATTARSVLWLGPSAAGQIVKADDSTHNDAGSAIASVWESGWIWEDSDPRAFLNRVGYVHAGASGAGNLSLVAYGADRTLSATPAAQALSAAPGYSLLFRFDLCPAEECSIRFSTNAVGAWFDINEFELYHRPYLTHKS